MGIRFNPCLPCCTPPIQPTWCILTTVCNINSPTFPILRPGASIVVKDASGNVVFSCLSDGIIYAVALPGGFAVGSGYTSAPTVHINGGGGSGATAVARVAGGRVIGIDMVSFGSGYTSRPTVTFTGGGGTGASANASFGYGCCFQIPAVGNFFATISYPGYLTRILTLNPTTRASNPFTVILDTHCPTLPSVFHATDTVTGSFTLSGTVVSGGFLTTGSIVSSGTVVTSVGTLVPHSEVIGSGSWKAMYSFTVGNCGAIVNVQWYIALLAPPNTNTPLDNDVFPFGITFTGQPAPATFSVNAIIDVFQCSPLSIVFTVPPMPNTPYSGGATITVTA